MSKTYRFILFVCALLLLLTVGWIIKGDLSFLLGQFWFSSGLLLLILLSLIDQPHFSKDTNVLVNTVTAAVSLLLVDPSDRDWTFWLFTGAVVYLSLSSYTLMWIRNNPLNEERRVVQAIARMNRQIGRPEAIFSAFFLWGALKRFAIDSANFNMLLWFWIVFMLLNMPELARALENTFSRVENRLLRNLVGTIFGVQSRNTFLVKLLRERPTMKLFDFVEFKYSVDNRIRRGLVFDVYLLNQEQWVKVLSNKEIDSIFESTTPMGHHSPDAVYRLTEIPENDYLTRFVGLVTEHSSINKIRFVYNSRVTVAESQLLEVGVQEKIVLFQVVEGLTKIELLEDKNQTGVIIGEAVQLGTWDRERFVFEQFGWVPEINAPVYLASDIPEPVIEGNEVVIGKIPGTNYPVILNKDVAITHHMAIIGVTGTGKSLFARNLVREFLADSGTKAICVDFTGEYMEKFVGPKPVPTIPDAVSNEIFENIDTIEREIAKNYNKDSDVSIDLKKKTREAMYKALTAFIQGSDNLSVFELPHVENTSGVLTYTKTFFTVLFDIARHQRNHGKRLSLILEEAHTIVPEWNFSGVSEKVSQPLLNSIAQIALQGRKYNVGLLVIAQRTANVSKTILTQCNTVISFQEFDRTSTEFLTNYFGTTIAASLTKLRFRQAIAAGKAFRSSVPMIFQVPEINEDDLGFDLKSERA